MFVVAAIVEHKPGVLFKISGMFRRRGFNIENISVGPTAKRDLARMTITMRGNELEAEQLVKQMDKLIDVIQVRVLDPANTVVRELALVKLEVSDSKSRSDIMDYVSVFRSRVVDVSPNSITVASSPTAAPTTTRSLTWAYLAKRCPR